MPMPTIVSIGGWCPSVSCPAFSDPRVVNHGSGFALGPTPQVSKNPCDISWLRLSFSCPANGFVFVLLQMRDSWRWLRLCNRGGSSGARIHFSLCSRWVCFYAFDELAAQLCSVPSPVPFRG